MPTVYRRNKSRNDDMSFHLLLTLDISPFYFRFCAKRFASSRFIGAGWPHIFFAKPRIYLFLQKTNTKYLFKATVEHSFFIQTRSVFRSPISNFISDSIFRHFFLQPAIYVEPLFVRIFTCLRNLCTLVILIIQCRFLV